MKLTYKKGRGEKIHISVDGEYALTVDETFWYALGISDGDEISDEEFESLQEAVNLRRAFNRAVDIISVREHSRREIVEKLNQKGFASVSEKAADLLVEKGYIDDRRFARLYASELKANKHMGKQAIAYRLYMKGVDRGTISLVLEDMDEQPLDDIRAIINKRYARALADEKGRRRTVNGLMRLGYRYNDIKTVMDEYTQGEEISGQ